MKVVAQEDNIAARLPHLENSPNPENAQPATETEPRDIRQHQPIAKGLTTEQRQATEQ